MHSLRFLTYLSLFLAALSGAWAEKWTRRATDKGESEAENILGKLGKVYLNGDGVKPDLEKAFGYYKTAADGGYVEAFYYVGTCYYYGNGVPEDKALAKSWIQKAADAGDKNADEFLRVNAF